MDKSEHNVRTILAGEAAKGAPVTVKGWVRTRRDSKAGISFVHLSDGSSFHPLQVVAPNTLANFAEEVSKLTAGCAVEATGIIAHPCIRYWPVQRARRDPISKDTGERKILRLTDYRCGAATISAIDQEVAPARPEFGTLWHVATGAPQAGPLPLGARQGIARNGHRPLRPDHSRTCSMGCPLPRPSRRAWTSRSQATSPAALVISRDQLVLSEPNP
jgi:hypothetical protein